jgi:hypothetical protein
MGGMQMGINTGYRFANPRGIYCYPLTNFIYDQLIEGVLPYLSNAEHIVFFELQNTDKWLDVNAQDKYPNWLDICRQMTENAKKMSGKINQSQNIDFDQILRDAENEARHWDLSNGAKIYDFGFFLKKFFVGEVFFKKDAEGEDLYRDKQAVAWQKFLQSVGFIGVYDEGESVLHPSEPTQLVALQVDALKRIKFYETKAFRKSKNTLEDYKSLKDYIKSITSNAQFGKMSSNMSPGALMLLAEDEDLSVRQAVAMHPKTPPEALMILAKDTDLSVKLIVISNPNITPEALIVLSKDTEENVRNDVGMHRKTPPEVLKILATDSSPYVKASVASNPKTPPEGLLDLAKDENPNIKYHVAHNTNAPPEALMILATDTDEDVLKGVVRNPNTPPEALMILAKNDYTYIRFYAAGHLNTPLEALLILSKDRYLYIREAVAKNPTYIKYLESNKSLSERWNKILKLLN